MDAASEIKTEETSLRVEGVQLQRHRDPLDGTRALAPEGRFLGFVSEGASDKDQRERSKNEPGVKQP
jgi:hypothetical protein